MSMGSQGSERSGFSIKEMMNKTLQHYDPVRFLGIDVLKFFLQSILAFVVAPLFFYDQLHKLLGAGIPFIYFSWLLIILASTIGFVAYYFVFEGYYQQAHMKGILENLPYAEGNEEMKKVVSNERAIEYMNKSNKAFNISYFLGRTALLLYCIAISLIFIAVGLKIYLFLTIR